MYIISFIIGILTAGCASIPCYPPSYFDPEPGAPYTSEEAFVSASDGAQLVGTLTLPSDVDPPFPAVILVTGSSPQNRDMLMGRSEPGCFYRPFRQIADSLSPKGNKKDIAQEPEMKELKRMIQDGELSKFRKSGI